MGKRRSTSWPNGRIPRQRVVPSKDIPVEQTGWFKNAAPWKQAEYLWAETEGRKRK